MFFVRDAFAFPADLSAALERVLWPAGNQSMETRRRALRRLWEKLAKGRGQAREGETHYSFQREEADAYAAYYLPANCLKTALVLEESFLAGIDPMPSENSVWLDCGTGPGTAYWGVAWWGARRGKGNIKFTGWDQSPVFQSLARNLCSASPFPVKTDFLASKEDPVELIRKIRPTHVSFVNSLAEVYPDIEKRTTEVGRILRALRELQSADGRERFLVLIEPGSRESSRELAALKDQIKTGGQVLFPCLDDRPCGALRDTRDWCHEEAACDFPDWLNELGEGAGMRKESLLFSYALIRAGSGFALPLANGLRMVSQRMERKGQVECRLCTTAGKRAARVQRSKATPENEFFLSSVRGDLWKEAALGEKNDVNSAVNAIPDGTRSIFDGT